MNTTTAPVTTAPVTSTASKDQPRNPKPYPHRWFISYTATAQTPLSIGDGRADSGRVKDPDEESRVVWHNTVARDASGQPYLAASGLKGALRDWAGRLGLAEPEIQDLFGGQKMGGDTADRGERRDKPEDKQARPSPGFLDLHDAHLRPLDNAQRRAFTDLAQADATTQTFIEAATRIDRDTQTVADRLLFNQERVAPGAAFSGSFLLQHPDQTEGAKLVSQLLGLLNAASDPAQGGLALGGDTGRGMGRVNFKNPQVSHFGPDQFKAWLNKGASGTWRDGAEKTTVPAAVFTPQQPVELKLNIRFTSRFLVNEPSRATQGEGGNAHTPRLDINGAPVLPATSLHGALRAQAERILRTLGLDTGGAGGPALQPPKSGRPAHRRTLRPHRPRRRPRTTRPAVLHRSRNPSHPRLHRHRPLHRRRQRRRQIQRPVGLPPRL